MKFINPSVEYWEQAPGLSGVWSQIAKATRVCYQSQQRKDETDEEFVKRVILKPAIIEGSALNGTYNFNKMHGAMLEHGTIYLKVPIIVSGNYDIEDLLHNKYSQYREIDNMIYITTNLRVILENHYGYLIDEFLASNNTNNLKRYTFSVITDIGVTREMNRHRTFSIAEQSTRYCDFNKDKFGNELTFIKPNWEYNISKKHVFETCCSIIEDSYSTLRKLGWKPEQARQVLPLGLKTQAVYTAFEDDWKHFLKLRADNVSGKVHPNMAIIANMIKDKFKEINEQRNPKI